MVYPYPRVNTLQYPEGNYLGYYFININITGGGGCYGHYTKLLRWKFPASFPLIHNKFALLFVISWLFLKKKEKAPTSVHKTDSIYTFEVTQGQIW